MIVTEAEAKKITGKVLSFSKADSCAVTLAGHTRRHVRFALNSVTTNGEQDDLSVAVTSSFGSRSGSARTNEFTDAALERVVRKAEEIARFAPPDPEFVPPFGPQQYVEGRTWFERTAKASPAEMSSLARPVLDEAAAKAVTAAGFFTAGSGCSAIATSSGPFARVLDPAPLFSVSALTIVGSGSGWACAKYPHLGRLGPASLRT